MVRHTPDHKKVLSGGLYVKSAARGSCCQPRNRRPADVVAARDTALRFSRCDPRPCFALLVRGELRLRPIFTPRALARSRPSPVRTRIRSRSNSARPPSTVSISRPCDVVVSAHASPSDRNPAFLPVMAARVFDRSRVDRASRSSRVTHTSPASSWPSSRRSCARSVLAPLATSRNTFLHPALVSWRTWASRSGRPSIIRLGEQPRLSGLLSSSTNGGWRVEAIIWDRVCALP